MNHPVIESATSGLHARLKAGTAALHQAVEDSFAPLDLGRRDDYAMFLSRHAAALLPAEAALGEAGIATTLPDWPLRTRAAALREDLAALDTQPPAPLDIRLRPGAEALGAAYVLEGSRLGAAVLLRQVGPGLPTAFLGHGARQGLWRSFLARLALLNEADAPAAMTGARRVFTLFLRGAEPA